ncbi:MAG: hypothetical protein JXA73_07165 [Acidobacteria bacterium]|nr:hypothetical protein [Acidobacteriota bacterium]
MRRSERIRTAMNTNEHCRPSLIEDRRRETERIEETVGQVLRSLCCEPKRYLLRRWNWKSALLSSIVRAAIFFAVNLTAGHTAALAAMIREFSFRAVASGFYGGITESFRLAKPRWAATLTVLVSLPILNHSAEFLLHWMLGTANLKTSILASVCFTILSTGFNLFAMRREVLITQQNSRSLAGDLKLIPGLLFTYCCAILRFPWTGLLYLGILLRWRKALCPFSSERAEDPLGS